VTCHQPDGGGVQDLNPPLTKTNYVLGDKSRLIRVVLNGLSMKEINGEKYSNTMPSFKHLSDKEIADVLTYIRNDFGNRASIVTAAEVKKLRSKK
jgi:mono/diheme cytochrome c family protein